MTNNSGVAFSLLFSIGPDFPCLADEIAEPRPYLNIKVAALTVSEKSINTSATQVRFSLASLAKLMHFAWFDCHLPGRGRLQSISGRTQ